MKNKYIFVNLDLNEHLRYSDCIVGKLENKVTILSIIKDRFNLCDFHNKTKISKLEIGLLATIIYLLRINKSRSKKKVVFFAARLTDICLADLCILLGYDVIFIQHAINRLPRKRDNLLKFDKLKIRFFPYVLTKFIVNVLKIHLAFKSRFYSKKTSNVKVICFSNDLLFDLKKIGIEILEKNTFVTNLPNPFEYGVRVNNLGNISVFYDVIYIDEPFEHESKVKVTEQIEFIHKLNSLLQLQHLKLGVRLHPRSNVNKYSNTIDTVSAQFQTDYLIGCESNMLNYSFEQKFTFSHSALLKEFINEVNYKNYEELLEIFSDLHNMNNLAFISNTNTNTNTNKLDFMNTIVKELNEK